MRNTNLASHFSPVLVLERWISANLLALCARIAMAGIFFYAGRTKVQGWLSVTDSTVELFRTEYQVPLFDPVIAAHLTAYAEHLLPLLLVLGLATRYAALATLAMVVVIQLFVYPDAWPTHFSWAALLLLLAGRGAGRWSLNHLLFKQRAADLRVEEPIRP